MTTMDTEAKPVSRKSASREARRPFGSHNQKLAYAQRTGYHRHWFNSVPGRIDAALAAGYAHVEDKEGKPVQRVVGVDGGGGPLVGYLMEVPEDWFQEDMARGQKAADQTDQAIRSGAVAGKPGEDGRYVPEHRGITIRDGNR